MKSEFMTLSEENTKNPAVKLGNSGGDYSHPMNASPEEYQTFLPGAYANYQQQAKRDQELFIRRFPTSKRHTTYLTHPQPVRVTNYLNETKNTTLPSASDYYNQDNLLADGPAPSETLDRDCHTRPARVVTVNRETDDSNSVSAQEYHPGNGHYQGFSKNIDNDSKGRGMGLAQTKCPEKKLTPVFPGVSMEQMHPSPEGIERINLGTHRYKTHQHKGDAPVAGQELDNVGRCCHPDNKILHCQNKMNLQTCSGPMLQSHYPSGAMSDRYLQTFQPDQYLRRDEHSFEWNEFSRVDGNHRQEINKRKTNAETREAVPYQLECTRVNPPSENCDRCHSLFHNMTRRKNLFQ